MARSWPIEFRDNEEIRLSKSGVWLSDGHEITHGETVRLFHRSLKRAGQGFEIAVGRESKAVVVEDTPYFVLGLEGAPASGLTLRLSDESLEKLEPRTLSYSPGRLVARVKGGAEEARFLNPAYFELLSGLQEDERSYFLVIEGKRVDLMARLKSFEEFWPFYVEQHSAPTNQRLHVAGVLAAVTVLAVAVALGRWALVPLAIAVGYAFSWVGHFVFERNKPATFQYPLWSFMGDLRMVSRKLRGKPLL
jgi:hypothetical protein